MKPPLALALAAVLPACPGPVVGAEIPGGGLPPVEPTFASISAAIFTPRCNASACHGGTGSAPLDLTPGAAYAALVNAPSTQADELLLVAPRAPDQSYLMLKLLGTHAAAGSGAIMPPDGERLPDEELAAVAAWILNGAEP